MRDRYSFDGRFKMSRGPDALGVLDAFVTEDSITIYPPQRQGVSLQIAPFSGSMFFGPWEHRRVDKIFERGYEIDLSGTDLGQCSTGGGPDGDFDIWRIKHAQIRGVFGDSGLSVSLDASTWRGSAVCYGTGESREDEYEALQVAVQFTVPPRDLFEFMGLQTSLRQTVFARFNWSMGDAP